MRKTFSMVLRDLIFENSGKLQNLNDKITLYVTESYLISLEHDKSLPLKYGDRVLKILLSGICRELSTQYRTVYLKTLKAEIEQINAMYCNSDNQPKNQPSESSVKIVEQPKKVAQPLSVDLIKSAPSTTQKNIAPAKSEPIEKKPLVFDLPDNVEDCVRLIPEPEQYEKISQTTMTNLPKEQWPVVPARFLKQREPNDGMVELDCILGPWDISNSIDLETYKEMQKEQINEIGFQIRYKKYVPPITADFGELGEINEEVQTLQRIPYEHVTQDEIVALARRSINLSNQRLIAADAKIHFHYEMDCKYGHHQFLDAFLKYVFKLIVHAPIYIKYHLMKDLQRDIDITLGKVEVTRRVSTQYPYDAARLYSYAEMFLARSPDIVFLQLVKALENYEYNQATNQQLQDYKLMPNFLIGIDTALRPDNYIFYDNPRFAKK